MPGGGSFQARYEDGQLIPQHPQDWGVKADLSPERHDPAVKSGLIHGPSNFREPGTHSLFDIWSRERKKLPKVSQEVGNNLEQEARMEPNHGSERWAGGTEPSFGDVPLRYVTSHLWG